MRKERTMRSGSSFQRTTVRGTRGLKITSFVPIPRRSNCRRCPLATNTVVITAQRRHLSSLCSFRRSTRAYVPSVSLFSLKYCLRSGSADGWFCRRRFLRNWHFGPPLRNFRRHRLVHLNLFSPLWDSCTLLNENLSAKESLPTAHPI